ncbi:MAG: amino acid permease [Gemmatimonadaceae bacterium]|nr:amino acid permease [Gemmatimonadaceae bacterium]NUQ94553.1 amino acid permease [Gemmatimonadaceae bacterium]NUR19820.1 amino acid permease [Gemmatimonadaceae bacterium]NUS97879.1 amino acid permease [Gemmatimonadaceae bacterium]
MSDPSMNAPRTGPTLIRAVGLWALAASIFNVTVGAGIFRLPGLGAEMLGAAAPLAYLICAVAMGLIVLCFAEAGSRVARTGGPYAYVEVVFGPFAGFLAGVLLWLMGTLAMAGVSIFFVGNLASVAPALGSGVARALVLAALLGFFTWVNVRGVRQGTRLIEVASVAKLLPLVLLIVLALPAVRGANLAIHEWPAAATLSRASIVIIFAFMGVESALVPSGEVRDPARTVPGAIAIAMIGVTVLYIATQVVAQGVLGAGLATSGEAPLATVAAAALGGWGRTLIVAGAAISMFGYVSGMTLAIPRALFAFAEDGILPRAVAAVHPRYRTPWVAIIVQSVIVFLVAVTSTFEQLAVIANLSALLLYGVCAIAAWELRRRGVRMEGTSPLTLPLGPTVHVLTLVVIGFLLTSIKWNEWAMVLGVLAVASLRFVVGRPRRAAAPVVLESAG